MIPRTILLSLLSAAAAYAAGPYNIVNPGLLDGTTSSALDVSNNLQITGNAQTAATNAAPRLNAYSYSGSGPMVNIGVLTGSNNFSRGYAINDNGVIVGESDNNISRAFVYSGGVMTGLTRLAGNNDRGRGPWYQ